MNEGISLFAEPNDLRNPLPIFINVFNIAKMGENTEQGEENKECVLGLYGYFSDFKSCQGTNMAWEIGFWKGPSGFISYFHDQAIGLEVDAKCREARAMVGQGDESTNRDITGGLTRCLAYLEDFQLWH